MLSPHDRTTLFEALRPPEGFVLEAAAGTSYSLDLETVLTVPVACAFYETTEVDIAENEVEPIGLLDAIRRHAESITIFCQAGQIAVPVRRRTVFAWLEDAVYVVKPPRPHRLFHPKVWLARFRAIDGESALLRVLCATRNLTFDTSSDTLLRAESHPYTAPGRNLPVEGQLELAELFRRLPQLAQNPIPTEREHAIASLADDLERVPLIPPQPFERLAFHVFGLAPDRPNPFPVRTRRSVVVSPFLGESFLNRFTRKHELTLLVSRMESLDRIPAAALGAVGRIAVLSSGVEINAETVEHQDDAEFDREPTGAATTRAVEHHAPGLRIGGLHAKLYLFDTDKGSRIFTGSANATAAGFDGNIEVLAELTGPRGTGVDLLLAEVPGEISFAGLLADYHFPDKPVEPDDSEKLEQELSSLRIEMASICFRATVEAADDHYLLQIHSDSALPESRFDSLELWTWPVTLQESSSALALEPGRPARATFSVTADGISSFIAVRATAQQASARATTSFLVNAQLHGAPSDRRSRLLAAMLRDRDRLLRYLLMLLRPNDEQIERLANGGNSRWLNGLLAGGSGDLPFLELLLQALDRNPDRLDHINRLLNDLAEERTELLPAEFDTVWEPIWRCRQKDRI